MISAAYAYNLATARHEDGILKLTLLDKSSPNYRSAVHNWLGLAYMTVFAVL